MWNDTLIETVRAAHGTELDLRALGFGRIGLASRRARNLAVSGADPALQKYLEPKQRAARAEALAQAAGVTLPANLDDEAVIRCAHCIGRGMGIGAPR